MGEVHWLYKVMCLIYWLEDEVLTPKYIESILWFGRWIHNLELCLWGWYVTGWSDCMCCDKTPNFQLPKKKKKRTNKQNKYFDFYYFSSYILPLLNTRLVCSQLNAIFVQSSNMTMEISLVDTVLKNVTKVDSSSSALNLRM